MLTIGEVKDVIMFVIVNVMTVGVTAGILVPLFATSTKIPNYFFQLLSDMAGFGFRIGTFAAMPGLIAAVIIILIKSLCQLSA